VSHFDIIIIGGGISGSGIARDAALRGLKVMLLERSDFASGASSLNGRMIHGGLRYLEQGEIGLVREALTERATLLRIAPHLVKRRDLIIPIRSGIGRPLWKVRLGLLALDLLSGGSAPRHRYIGRDAALRRVPSLAAPGLRGAAVMFDAFAEHAERLTVENLLAAAAHGAVVHNHAPVERLLTAPGKITGVAYRDREGQSLEAFAPIVINATGAWADEFLSQAAGANRKLLGPSKGTFVALRPFAGAPDGSVFFEARSDSRPIILTPWNGLLLLGTTDERVTGAIDAVSASEAEIDYLLAELNGVFEGASATRQAVLYSYTGVRPLPLATGSSTTVPRKHVIHHHAPAMQGLFTVLGGKLSTFRSLAEEMVDTVFVRLGRSRVACRTASEPLPGGRTSGQPDSAAGPTQRRLSAIYGWRAADVVSIAEADPSLAVVVDDETGAIAAEIVLAVRDEWARTFEDILVRRTLIGRNSRLGLNALDSVAEIAAGKLGWSAARIKNNREQYLRYVELSRAFTHHPHHTAAEAH